MTARRPHLLLLSGGSKVAIARIAKAATLKRGIAIHISDTQEDIPTRLACDQFSLLPEHSDSHWADTLLDFCQSQKIGLVIPTRHSELKALATLAPELEKQGTSVAISGIKAIELCNNKLDTYAHLKEQGLPAPETFATAAEIKTPKFPYVSKPINGSASQGVRVINSAEGLMSAPADWLIQESARGREYTVNLYLNRQGEPLCAIPHRRLVIESGEVVQARTERLESLISLCQSLARTLPEARGIINIQAFHDPETGEITVIEVNPRIGGGYPLCDAAKGTYLEWLCQEYLDQQEPRPFSNWTDGLTMLRYRDAFFTL